MAVERAVDDQLPAPVEEVVQGLFGAGRTIEAVLLFNRHARHPAALGGERVAGVGSSFSLPGSPRVRHPLLRGTIGGVSI